MLPICLPKATASASRYMDRAIQACLRQDAPREGIKE